MTSTTVVRPLHGAGVVARAGDLLLVCADGASGVDDLLSLVTEVADGGGNGTVLVRRLAALLAVDEYGRYPACAACGPAADGALAVLVHGSATADLVGAEGPVSLSGAGAIASVTRLVPGPVPSVRLQLPNAGTADPRTRLDAGVISAAGLVAEGAASGLTLPTRPAGESYRWERPAPSSPAPAYPAAAYPQAQPEPVVDDYAEFAEPDEVDEVALVAEPAATELGGVAFAATELGGVAFAATEAVAVGRPESGFDVAGADEPGPWVSGVRCPNGHFTDPELGYCLGCGAGLVGQALAPVEGHRPSLGLLVLDDGASVRLDLGYVIGREPQHDPEVVAGTARGLKMIDAEGVVSRRHLRITLSGWEVQLTDLGSANGTYVQAAGDEQRHQLVAGLPVVIRPGTQVTLGRRWLRYDLERV
jgi:hypothetical protein